MDGMVWETLLPHFQLPLSILSGKQLGGSLLNLEGHHAFL